MLNLILSSTQNKYSGPTLSEVLLSTGLITHSFHRGPEDDPPDDSVYCYNWVFLLLVAVNLTLRLICKINFILGTCV